MSACLAGYYCPAGTSSSTQYRTSSMPPCVAHRDASLIACAFGRLCSLLFSLGQLARLVTIAPQALRRLPVRKKKAPRHRPRRVDTADTVSALTDCEGRHTACTTAGYYCPAGTSSATQYRKSSRITAGRGRRGGPARICRREPDFHAGSSRTCRLGSLGHTECPAGSYCAAGAGSPTGQSPLGARLHARGSYYLTGFVRALYGWLSDFAQLARRRAIIARLAHPVQHRTVCDFLTEGGVPERPSRKLTALSPRLPCLHVHAACTAGNYCPAGASAPIGMCYTLHRPHAAFFGVNASNNAVHLVRLPSLPGHVTSMQRCWLLLPGDDHKRDATPYAPAMTSGPRGGGGRDAKKRVCFLVLT